MNRFFFILLASLLLMYSESGCAQNGTSMPTKTEIKRPRIRILTVGIGLYDNRDPLNSAQDLYRYGQKDSIAYKYIFPSYQSNERVVSLNGRVNSSVFSDSLYQFALRTRDRDVVIIHILGHGEVSKNGEYRLVCSDDKVITGDVIRNQIFKMADEGALVIIFLDTCHAGALFDGKGAQYHSFERGSIAFFSSSSSSQSSYDIEQKTLFTQTILKTLSNGNDVAFDAGTSPKYMTLGGLEKVINTAFHGNTKQTPQTMFFPIVDNKAGKLDNYQIKYYPIIKKIDPGAPKKKTPRYVYAGAAVGTNITPTPYTNVNIGVDINQRHKIEIGASLAFVQTDDVYIYDKNGILQNGYKYRGWNIYGRYGYNVMPENSKLEIVPLIGLSGNFISGKQLSGYNSDIGKSASSLMGSVNCRFAHSLCKDKKILLHGTLGCDIPIKKDGNVDILKENKYIKNWCSIRPYIEIGIIAKLFHL